MMEINLKTERERERKTDLESCQRGVGRRVVRREKAAEWGWRGIVGVLRIVYPYFLFCVCGDVWDGEWSGRDCTFMN